MTLPLPRADIKPHSLHTHFKVPCLPSRESQPSWCNPSSKPRACPLFPPPSICPPTGRLRFLQAPLGPPVWGVPGVQFSLLPVLPSNYVSTVKYHMWTPGIWGMAGSLGTHPKSIGLPPCETIHTGLGLEHCCLVASKQKVKTRTQRVTCFSRCSGFK